MSVEQNKATLRRVFEEVWNKENLDLIPELVSPDYVHRGPRGESRGHEGYRQMVTSARSSMPDLHYTIEDVVGEGDTLAARLSWTGTFMGKVGDIEVTGKKVNMTQALFNRYVDGKCVEAIPFMNMAILLQQLGITLPGG